MSLTVHHLGKSQSERIVWLCEELDIQYALQVHDRDPETALAPPSIKSLSTAGTAPVMVDDTRKASNPVVLAESAAIVEYIINLHGNGRLIIKPGEDHYVDFVNWFHFANGSVQPTIGRSMMLHRVGPEAEQSAMGQYIGKKLQTVLKQIDTQLEKTGAYLAGPFSAADIMTVFSISTMRGFSPIDLSPYPNILRYLKDVGQREAYQRAMKKGDPDITPMLGPTVERFQFGKR